MSAVLELIEEVSKFGATLRAEPPDLVIIPAGIVPVELKARLKQHKPDILRSLLELEESMRRRVIPPTGNKSFQDSGTKETKLTKKGIPPNLETRLLDRGISIAIDRATGSALLLFTPSDQDIVKNVADVYEPFKVKLTPAQREELSASMDYYEEREAANAKALELWFREQER
jgi:hypothetical protein